MALINGPHFSSTVQPQSRAYEVVVSVFIAAVLLAQAATLGDRYLGTKIGGRRFWPILSYMMYDDPHYAGETIKAYYPLEGVLKDGRVVEITREDLGLDFWNYLHLGDSLAQNQPAALNLLVTLYKKSNQLVELRVKTLPVMVTRQGQAYKAPEILRTIPIRDPGAMK
jgi:hypothetical protein